MNYPATKLPKYFYRTAPQPCPYLRGRRERNIFAELNGPDMAGMYDLLARHGFRRSHRIIYRPECPSCSACVPVRVVVPEFATGRSLRRVLRANADLTAYDAPNTVATPEQYRLFGRYVSDRHACSEMSAMSFQDYRAMIQDTTVDTHLTEFRDADDTLLAACLTDRLGDGLSAVYSFFEPGCARRGLGTFMVLWLIERARAHGLRYAYLGYWIAASRKMSYKARFQPLEALGEDGWRRLELARP